MTDIPNFDTQAASVGLEIMSDVLGIIYNRGSVTDTELLALSGDDIAELYEAFIGPAIDKAEDCLLEGWK